VGSLTIAERPRAPGALALDSVWIETASGLAQLEVEWRNLFRSANPENAFLTFGWMSTWWKHFGKGELAVIALRDASGRLAAVAPFYIARTRPALGARRLGFLADTHVGSDYLDILADPGLAQPAAAEIARALLLHRERWNYIELRDAADSPLLADLTSHLERSGMHAERAPGQICYYISLPTEFSQYLSGIGIGPRANFRRRWRNLQRDHQGECVTFTEAQELEHNFGSLLTLHRLRFEQRRMDSAFLAPGVPEFHTDVLRSLAADGLARLFLLKAGGQPVAALYGFSVGKTFQFYQSGIDPRWMHQGTGQVIIGKAIEHAIAIGQNTFDFLRGGEPYKAQWARQSRQTVSWRLFDHRRGSLAAQLGMRASRALHSAVRIIPLKHRGA
jgi:CelD/BcsL family acetyltransferase involved in cellulose biosynthesis